MYRETSPGFSAFFPATARSAAPLKSVEPVKTPPAVETLAMMMAYHSGYRMGPAPATEAFA